MKIVLAPDSFKESMTATAAARAMAQGVRKVFPSANCLELPMSDGGEGFTEAISNALDGTFVTSNTVNALGQKTSARWAYVAHARIAVIESAQACGLELVTASQRDLLQSNSYGLGILIKKALDLGASKILIGLGGTATNDLGTGMLAALGAKFLAASGQELTPTPQGLQDLSEVDLSNLDPRLSTVEIEVACDVNNPLTGPNGCAAVFGPQKGATPEMVDYLDRLAGRITELTQTVSAAELPGCGAAGGLGWALHVLLKGALIPGIDLVMKTINLPELLAGAELVFTGEGAMDRQTLNGKTPFGVAQTAKEMGIDCLAFTGHLGDGVEDLLTTFKAIIPITTNVCTLEEALANAEQNLETAAETVTRLWYHESL